MSDNAHPSDELFVTTQDEVANGDGSTTDESSEDELFDKETKENDAQAVQKGTIESLQRKLDSGEITVDTIPAKQKWAIAYLKVKSQKADPDVKTLIAEELQKRESQTRYETLKAQLNNASLKASQKQVLQTVFDELKGGVPRDVALKNAILAAGIDLKDQSSKKDAMKLPTPGYVGNQVEEDFVPYKFEEDGTYKGPQGTPEQRIAALEKARKGGGASRRDQYRK